MHDEIKRMKAEIADYEEKHGKIERKPNTVSTKAAEAATSRIKPLISYIIKYAKLCDDSDSIVDLSDEHTTFINSFDADLQTMQGNAEYRVPGRMIAGAVHLMNNRSRYDEAEPYVTRLSVAVGASRLDVVQRAFNRGGGRRR